MKQIIRRILSFIKPKSSYKSLNRITISSDAIKHNFSIFHQHKPHYTIIPVLKSNAYGHGIKQIAQIIDTIPECKLIAVDSYPEYQIIHKHTDKDILIMGETWCENYKLFDTKRTHFAVRSPQVIKMLGSYNKNINIHIFVNTGMNREWIKLWRPLEELIATVKQCKHIQVSWVMSHLACADDIHSPMNAVQSDAFYHAVQYINAQWMCPKYIHLEASAGMINNIDHHGICTAGRLWLWLYGIDPQYREWLISEFWYKLQPALDIYSTITSIQNVKPSETVWYNWTWQADRDQIIGTFPFGYREGLDRGLSGKWWKVKIWESYHEIIWRISMNYAWCLWNNSIKIWDTVHIMSSNNKEKNSIYNFYDRLGRIPYEIVKIDDKVKRVIR